MGKITILNKHQLKCEPVDAIYIGRGSPLGNPFPVKYFGLGTCIEMYKEWLTDRIRAQTPEVIDELDRIAFNVIDKGQATLLCFCKPNACHGDYIAEVVLDKVKEYRARIERPQLIYAGIGSRKTPLEICQIMTGIAEQLAPRWILRSGYADGADKAFHFGARRAGGKIENYIPWTGFNRAPVGDPDFIVPEMTDALISLAAGHHPWWNNLKDGVKKLHARNGCQILGPDLTVHSKMVICWTENGAGGGGTGQALRIARAQGIPIFDLALAETPTNLMKFVEDMEAAQ